MAPAFSSIKGDKAANEGLLLAECQRQGVTNPRQQAFVLGTAYHESGAFQFLLEIASGDAYEGRSDLGNNQPGDGRKFKGRGYAQITGRVNYERYTQVLGKDLIANPNIVSDDAGIAAFITVHGIRTNNFTKNSTAAAAFNSGGDFATMTRLINAYPAATRNKVVGYCEDYLKKLQGGQIQAGAVSSGIGENPAAGATTTSSIQSIISELPEPEEDPYLDKCPHLLMRGIVTDYGRTTSESYETVLSVTGESYGKIYKDAYVLTDLNSPDSQSVSLEVRQATQVPMGVADIYYRLLDNWVAHFWGNDTGWEPRTRPIPFPPNFLTRINNEGSVFSNLVYISIDGFFHLFVDHTGALVWEKLPWSSKDRSLIEGRDWEDLQSYDLPSWKILNWSDRLSEQNLTNFLRCVPTMAGMGNTPAGMTALIYNVGSIRQYGGTRKRELHFPIGTDNDQYYGSHERREQEASANSFVDLCALEAIRWYDRPIQRVSVTARGESAWRIHTKIKIAEDWHCRDAKIAEYYVVSRTHQIRIQEGAWTTSLELTRDRRTRYLGIGVGDVDVILTPEETFAKIQRSLKGSPIESWVQGSSDRVQQAQQEQKPANEIDRQAQAIADTQNKTTVPQADPDKEKEEAAQIPQVLATLEPDRYYMFDRFTGKVIPIGNDPIAWADEKVVPRLGEKGIEVQPLAQTQGTSTTPAPATGQGGAGQYNAAIAAKCCELTGMSTRGGPGGGDVACAWWAMGHVVKQATGGVVGKANTNYCPTIYDALQTHATKIAPEQAQPGDIVIASNQHHIGIMADCGKGLKCYSNSSSKAIGGGWVSDVHFDGHYGGKSTVWRIHTLET